MNKTVLKAYDIFKILPKEGKERALNYMKALKMAEEAKKKENQ